MIFDADRLHDLLIGLLIVIALFGVVGGGIMYIAHRDIFVDRH